nr:secreted frizzled-related protein 1 [Odocoileus virginianus texanus]
MTCPVIPVPSQHCEPLPLSTSRFLNVLLPGVFVPSQSLSTGKSGEKAAGRFAPYCGPSALIDACLPRGLEMLGPEHNKKPTIVLPKSTPLCAPFPSTLPRDCRSAIIRLSHLETRLPFIASKQPDSTFPRVFAGAELHRPGMERQTSLATAFLSPGPPERSRRPALIGRRGTAGALLALAAGLLAAGSASEYDYVSFQSDIGAYQSGRFYTKPPQCVDIPADLRLCHNVGYKRMVLPNLLEHETMAEVKQQASSWVPLLNKNCHIGTQVFLCSLFAPVCLDRPIYPCRWLCEAVRDSCEPVMQFFGFYWPEMLKCDKFPEGDVCIAMTPPNATEASKPQGTTVCPPCDNELKSEAIIEHLCASEFALRMKIKEVKKENGDKKIVPKKKKPLKLGPIKKKELKKLVLYLKNGADCPCHQLDNLSQHFLIMGRKVKSQYLLTAIHKWDKKNKEFKNFMKKMKNHECPTFQSVFK